MWAVALGLVSKPIVASVYRSCALARVSGASAVVRVPSGVGLTFVQFHKQPMQAALSAALGREVTLDLEQAEEAGSGGGLSAAGRDGERGDRSGTVREDAPAPGEEPEIVRRAVELFGGTIAGVHRKRERPGSDGSA